MPRRSRLTNLTLAQLGVDIEAHPKFTCEELLKFREKYRLLAADKEDKKALENRFFHLKRLARGNPAKYLEQVR